MTKQINTQAPSTPIVDSMGRPTVEFYSLIEQLTGLEILSGTVDPNGAVQAKTKTLYWNSDPGENTLWFKTTGPNDNTGWLQISQSM